MRDSTAHPRHRLPGVEWRTKRADSRSTLIGFMVDAAITTDLKLFIEKVDKAGIPNQLHGYLSTLAGQGAEMVPSAHTIPELQKLLDEEMKKHRARIAGSKAVAAVAKGKLGAFSQEMEFLKAFSAAHDKPIADQDEE